MSMKETKGTVKQRVEVTQPNDIVKKVEEIFQNVFKDGRKVEAILSREVDNRIIFSVEVAPSIFAESNQDFSDELTEAILNANSYMENADKPHLKELLAQHYNLENFTASLTRISLKN